MSDRTVISSTERLQAKLPPPLYPLIEIALNFWWSWSAEGESIFRDIDTQLWDNCHQNPVKFLLSLSPKNLTQFASDPTYLNRLDTLSAEFNDYMQRSDRWAIKKAPQIEGDRPIAYFCFEFGVHQSLPNYAGGLGVLAGDHLKSASDLGLPIVGVGLLYQNGYFEQHFNREGWQREYHPNYQFEEFPLELLHDENGEPIAIEIGIRGRSVTVQIWQVRVGRVNVYLLDTNCDDNDPIDRSITNCLYGGDQNNRIAQEFLLGIGGIGALQRLGIEPSLYHLNEGHAAFALLELIHQSMQQKGLSFEEAKDAVRSRCAFTTHTPVLGGHDRFSPELIDELFADYWPKLGLDRERFMDLGARKPSDPWAQFNMTVLALRLTRSANGVSELNGEVARQMWSAIYPDRPAEEVPIGSITNGVHPRTWVAPLMGDLYGKYLGKDWGSRVSDRDSWEKIYNIPDRELWQRHQTLKNQLIAYTRAWLKQARSNRGEETASLEACDRCLDPDILTIGFARRFSPYKRPELILHDLERAFKIFGDRDRPVQILFAGKAHPRNDESKRLMQRLIEWSQNPEIQGRVVFIEDYDMLTAKKLIQGVDLWLNTPRRPLEASGTSGQKVALNGGLNFSILDGWWREAYQGGSDGQGINGWAIGEDRSFDSRQEQDRHDAESLYRILEQEIIPLYYDRNSDGIPQGWIEKMKASISTIAPVFNSDRMLAEYVTQIYVPQINADLELVYAR